MRRAVAVPGCEDAVGPSDYLPPLDMADLDRDAGTWRMIVLSSADQITVPAPAGMESAAYQAELVAVRRAQSSVTPAQRQAVEFWSASLEPDHA